ncbi:tropomyosin-2-like [Chenopodium quinoa]|uniref:tropomyosin-2-like n=1 Tax=Chenopodium quinoa TaxID=63459 RepID=UPI000B79AD22|nr:tropomyosin-2-like [Chenopodium quinoa]
MLRVEGLKRAYTRKSEEVRRSKRAIDDAHNVADYSLYMHGLESKFIRMEQAEKTKALQQQIDQLKNQVDQLQASLDDANKKLEEQKEPLQRLSKAKTENGRLAKENERLLKEAAAASKNFKATLESEQERLIEENEHDCANRMQRAFSLIHPEADFTVWELAFKYSDLAILAEEANEPGPGPYDAWVREEIARRQAEAAEEEEFVPEADAAAHPDPTQNQPEEDQFTVRLE